MIPAGAPVVVEWNDITDYSDIDWNEDWGEFPTSGVQTIGWLGETWKPGHMTVHLARDRDDEGKPRGVRAFPAGCFSTITHINPVTIAQWELSRLVFRRVGDAVRD